MSRFLPHGEDLKTAIAAAAARAIAEEGCDYATAKRRASREVLGEGAASRAAIPDNALVESELRRYLRIFAADSQPAELACLRRMALHLMRRLHTFDPHLVGAVLNGTATAHSCIRLNLFTDSAKDVEIYLLNQGVSFDVREAGPDSAMTQELLDFTVHAEASGPIAGEVAVTLAVMDPVALRVAPSGKARDADLHPVERSGRASVSMLERLLAETATAQAPAAGGEADR
jgi:hypothetical protein